MESPRPGASTQGRVLFGYLDTAARDVAEAADAVVVVAGIPTRALWRLQLGEVSACLVAGTAVEVVPHHPSPGDGLAAGLVLSGEVVVEQHDRALVVGPGQVVLYSAATPYRVRAEGPHHFLVARVPSSRLRVRALDTDPAFAADLRSLPSASALAALLRALTELPAAPAASAAQHLGDALADCVHAVLAEQHQVVAPAAELFARMSAWLDARLGEPDLGTEALARSQFLSARHVRKVFAQHGTTVTHYVRRARLEAIRGELLDPRHRDVSIAAVATRWGMRDPSAFSRAFSQEYGVSPRRFRARHDAPGPAPTRTT